MASLPSGDRGAGSGMLNTSRQLGFLLGVAILVAVFGHTMHTSVVRAAEKARTVVNAQPLLSKELKHYINLGIDQAEKVNATANITDLRKVVHPLDGVPLPPVNASRRRCCSRCATSWRRSSWTTWRPASSGRS